jgi:hypothetical protein
MWSPLRSICMVFPRSHAPRGNALWLLSVRSHSSHAEHGNERVWCVKTRILSNSRDLHPIHHRSYPKRKETMWSPLRSICMVLFLMSVVLCAVPVAGKNPRGLQVIAIEGQFLDSADRPLEEYDYLQPGHKYQLAPETKVLFSTLDGKKSYRATGPGTIFSDASGRVSLNGKALKAKDQHPLLHGVSASGATAQKLAGIPLRQLQVVPDEEKRSSIHEVNGYAYLGEDTTPRKARAEALAIAKRQALEMARVRLESNTLIKDGKLEYDFIKSGAEGVVTVLAQKDHGLEGNRYHVWIRAEVKYGLKPSEKQKEAVQTLFAQRPLTVKVWTPQKAYHRGQKVVVHMMGNRDFYARIVNVDSEGTITQLLPNDYRSSSRFTGGTLYRVPGEGDRFAIKVMDNYGEEQIVVYASETPLGRVETKPAGAGLRGFGGTREQLSRDTRAIKVVPVANRPDSGAGFYEAVWKFSTSP